MEKLSQEMKRRILRDFAKILYQNDLYNFRIERHVVRIPDEHGFMTHRYSGNIEVEFSRFEARPKESK